MISRLIRDEVLAKLRDGDTGINATLRLVCEEHGIEQIAFDVSDGSPQLIQGFFEITELEGNSDFRYPLILLYGLRSENLRRSKPAEFDGDVEVALDCWLDHAALERLDDFEHKTDALEQALVTTFNKRGITWKWPIAYDGEIGFERGPMRLDSNKRVWRRLLACRLKFLMRQ